jgi:hypothetical protein
MLPYSVISPPPLRSKLPLPSTIVTAPSPSRFLAPDFSPLCFHHDTHCFSRKAFPLTTIQKNLPSTPHSPKFSRDSAGRGPADLALTGPHPQDRLHQHIANQAEKKTFITLIESICSVPSPLQPLSFLSISSDRYGRPLRNFPASALLPLYNSAPAPGLLLLETARWRQLASPPPPQTVPERYRTSSARPFRSSFASEGGYPPCVDQ